MSTTDQLLVKAFRQAPAAKFASASVATQAAVADTTSFVSEPVGYATELVDAPVVEAPEVEAPVDDARAMIGMLNRQAAGIATPGEERPSAAQAGLSVATEEHWQPALEVDHFSWPPVVDTILSTVGETIGQLTDRLAQAAANRTQIVAVTGDRPESGTTTMTLAMARLFAEQNLSVALVDLDEPNPALAQALGVRPMISWLATLDDGVALEEVLIESVQDKITLSPLCQSAGASPKLDATNLAQRFWQPLANHFDVILADCGTAANSERLGSVLSAAGVAELIVVADNRCEDGTVAELARPLLEQISPVHWSVIRNFCGA